MSTKQEFRNPLRRTRSTPSSFAFVCVMETSSSTSAMVSPFASMMWATLVSAAWTWAVWKRSPRRSQCPLNEALAERSFRPAHPAIAGYVWAHEAGGEPMATKFGGDLIVDSEPDADPEAEQDLALRRISPGYGSEDSLGKEMATVRALSYNVLADGPRFGMGSAWHLPTEWRLAGSRFPRVVRELNVYDGDVVGLQEVQDEFVTDFLFDPRTGLDLASFHHTVNPRWTKWESQGREPYRPPLERNGDSLLVKQSTFRSIATSVVSFFSIVRPYFETLMGYKRPNESDASASRTPIEGLIHKLRTRPDGVNLSLLEHIATGKLLLVANTHICWDPKKPDVKSTQAGLVGFAIRQFANKYKLRLDGDMDDEEPKERDAEEERDGDEEEEQASRDERPLVPFIIMGDMNCFPFKSRPDKFDEGVVEEKDTDEQKTEFFVARRVAEEVEGEMSLRVRTVPGVRSGLVELFMHGVLFPDHFEHPARRDTRPNVPALQTFIPPVRSVYHVARGADPPITTRTATFEGCLDFIFVSESIQVLAVLDMPYPLARNGDRLDWSGTTVHAPDPSHAVFAPMPNEVWPSDHLMIGADLRF